MRWSAHWMGRGAWTLLVLAAFCLGTTARSADADDCPPWFPDLSRECERQARPEGSVMPMSFPYIFEDPYVTSGLNFVGIWHEFPDDSVFLGGQLGVLALQIRLALTERLGFIATKDGIGFLDQDNAVLKDDTGLLNMTLGFKYAAWEWEGEDRSAIVTPSLRYEIPLGQRGVFQDHDDGMLIPAISGAYQHGAWHVIAGIGGHAPLDGDKNSSNFFYNFHFNHAFPLGDRAVTHVVPFIELNGINWTGSGNGSRTINTAVGPLPIGTGVALLGVAPFEGVDVVNLGNLGVSGNNYVTMAWGVRLPMERGLSLGVAYERPLSSREDLTEQRVTTMLTWEF